MASDLTVRRYDTADADAVWRVHEAALRASPLPFVDDAPDDDLERVERAYLDRGGEFLVGVVDDRVVAVGGFLPEGDAIEIRRMRVHPDSQGRGYGGRLLAALERRARDRGFETAVLETHEALDTAQSLYESRGYQETNRESNPTTGDEFVRYRKRL